MNDLSDMLIKYRIVHEQAIYDPEGFDCGETKAAVDCIQTIISERERNFRAEIERLEAGCQELRTQLDAWHAMFGASQLSHAIAAKEAKDKECQRLREAIRAIASNPDCCDGDCCDIAITHYRLIEEAAALAKEGA